MHQRFNPDDWLPENEGKNHQPFNQGPALSGFSTTEKGMEHGAWGVEQEAPSSEPQALSSDPHSPCSMPQAIDLPTLPASVYAGLPEFLQKVVAPCQTNEERDVMLLGALAAVSAALPKVYGIYDNKRVFPNLFLYIIAQASAGKGNLVFCKRLVNGVHRELRLQSQAEKAKFEAEMREYNLMKMKDFSATKPVRPPEKMLFIPANNSNTGVFQLLSDNDGKGLIFETEGDTLALAFKSEYGNFSDGLRKAFHNEDISYYRRTDREFVEIVNPCLSAVLSSTPRQVTLLIPDAENGLLSRFAYYHMNIKPVWKDVLTERDDDGLEGYYDALGKEFLPLYKALKENPAIKFSVTAEQHEQFNVFFDQMQDKYVMLDGMESMATIRRMGLIAWRIAMIFTILRIIETGDFSTRQVCRDEDFQAALSMARILLIHASHVQSQLPAVVAPAKPKNKQEQFLEMLPGKFNHQEMANLAKSLFIPLSSADRYMAKFCEKGFVRRDNHGSYTKLIVGEAQNDG